MHDRKPAGSLPWAVLLFLAAIFGFNSCGDVDNVSRGPAPAAPGPLTILTSSPLPAGTTTVFYDITLAPGGGTPPYTWSLAPGSPTLPDGLVLAASTGKISGTPTTTGTIPTEFKLQDSTGKSVQKVLSITVNIAPTPLAILTNSLTPGTINQPYAFALGGTGGTTPYTWGLKAGSPPLPSGLTLDKDDGGIRGTPTVTSNDIHIFTLTDATSLTVEKSLQLSINAIPLSITTTSLPVGTVNQSYSATLTASGGTPPLTWSPVVTPPLPSGLTLNTSGEISGIPTVVSNQPHTFTVTDSTPPTNQTATKSLQLTIGAAPPTLTIPTPSLPDGTVTQNYSATVMASGGTPPYTWSIVGGLAPAPGLSLSPSGPTAGQITGTPSTNQGSPFTRTYQVQDSAVPPQTKTKDLTITVGLPTALNITTPSLPNGVLNQPYNPTVQATGGSGTRNWSFLGGNIPNLTINPLTGVISGNPTPTGEFTFTVQVTDALFTDTKDFTITITAPPAPSITTSSLPIGTVNILYSAQLQAINGAPPLNFQPVGLPFGLTFNVTPNSSTATITGTPTSNGSQNVTFTVNDSKVPFPPQSGTRTLLLTVNAALTINTTSLPNGTVGVDYGPITLTASGGSPPYTWSITGTGQPDQAAPGLTLSLGGIIGGSGQTPTIADSFTRTYRVQDNNGVAVTKSLTLNVNAALIIDDTSLPAGQVNVDYGPVTLTASGGTPPYTWSPTVTPPLPAGLSIDAAGTISGIPTVDETDISHTFTVTDSASTPANANKALSLTIDP